MKGKITFFIIMTTTICLSQSSDKWKQYIEKENAIKAEKYYFTSIENAHRNRYKIIKKLDSAFCIIENQSAGFNKRLQNIEPVNSLWKLPSDFSNHTEERPYIIASDALQVLITDLKSLQITDIQILDANLVLIKSDSKKIADLIAPLNSVSSISQESLLPKTESKIADQNFSINVINKAHADFPHLNGEDQTVVIKDALFDTNDIDLFNKRLPSAIESATVSDHATAMATIVAGLGNSSALGKGVAQKAKLLSSDFLNIFPDEIAALQGAFTANHSYGTEIENFYGSLANAYDNQLFLNADLTHCFSSGNVGLQGFKSITGNFKQSKNSIVVGCIGQNEEIMPFSSKGPAYDGRIKPELVAFSSQGTSNSSALASGIITLMKQHYKNLNNTNLSNAAVKAVLINSAKDLGRKGPDFTYGYGNINADKSLTTISENRIISSSLTSGQTQTHIITVPENVKNLKITLVWNDPPAAINSNISLVNDLDIEAITADSSAFLPWILNPNAPEELAKRGKNQLNNIEQITIENPISGPCKINISGTYIFNTSQSYSIAYEYELKNQFQWNYPAANDNFPYDGKTVSPFKWDSSFADAPGTLSISYNDGKTWEIIAKGIDMDSGQFTYAPSEKRFSKAKLKMVINDADYISDSFIVSYDLNIRTSLVCDGTTEINWDKPEGVTAFNIYQLAGDHFEFTKQTATTDYAYTDGKIYTVTAVFDNGEGIKSESVLQYTQNSNCYFELAFAEVYEKNKIKIDASIFSLYNIKSIELIKMVHNTQSVIGTINEVQSKTFSFLDSQPTDGSNKYQINLILQNDKVVISPILETNYLASGLFFLYPTLLGKNEELIIEAQTEQQAVFYLYAIGGQNIMAYPLASMTNSVNLKNASSGLYLYKIVTASGEVQTGKIAIF